MKLRILYFGILKEQMGSDGETLSLPSSFCVQDLLHALREKNSARVSEDVWKSLAVAVNHEYANAECVLREGDEVALLPPVSGG